MSGPSDYDIDAPDSNGARVIRLSDYLRRRCSPGDDTPPPRSPIAARIPVPAIQVEAVGQHRRRAGIALRA